MRAHILDGEGKTHLVDITRHVNWTGWKTFHVDLDEYDLQYPIRLKRIYVANPEERQDEREPRGAIAVDDVSFIVPAIPEEDLKTLVELSVGSKLMKVDGKERSLDQSPVIVDGTTLVPLRFVSDALGGEIGWNNAEKKVTLLRRQQLIDMWIGQEELIVNGEREAVLVAPKILNGRTMVPLRFISENFGWKVHWDNETKTITLGG